MECIFDIAPVPIRADLSRALGRAHSRLGQSGDWLNGEQRLAVVAEMRHSWDCDLCRLRKSQPSPYSLTGKHQTLGDLPVSWVDVIHRAVNDPGRLSERWFKEALSSGLLEDEFVEIIIVCVQAIAIDIFSSAIGINLVPLPKVEKGYPPRNRPSEAKIGPGWVATISPEDAFSDFSDFYSNESQFYIRRSMTLVKKGSRHLWDLLNHLYLEDPRLSELEGVNWGISRAQIEFLAARASSLLGCYYWTTSHAMRLRVSGEQTGHKYQLDTIMDGNYKRSGLPNGNILNFFVQSIIDRNEAGISVARSTITNELGERALVDVAATIAAFNAYPRMADSTGIPLEDAKKEITLEMRRELGMEALLYEE